MTNLDDVARALKHLPGQHNQLDHAPKKGGNLGERATSLMDDLNVRVGGAISDIRGEIERGKLGGAFDISRDADVKTAIESMGFKQTESFGKMIRTTVYEYGSYKGKKYQGTQVSVLVKDHGKGVGYVNIEDHVAEDIYNTSQGRIRPD